MENLRGKVAVVTGAASGIGRAMAGRFAEEGMKLVLADVEAAPLLRAEAELRAAGADAIAVPTDVSSGPAVEALATRALAAFGAVHVVCNNAGVGGAGGPLWTLTAADWEWTINVNLWGVIHGVRVFVPLLVAQGEGHVVNTASLAGLATPQFLGPYVATKHAVVALSEVLVKDLQIAGSPVGVSVLCPSFVRTNIDTSERNRPAHLRGAGASGASGPAAELIHKLVSAGRPPEEIALAVASAIRERRFYILSSDGDRVAVKRRLETIVEGKTPEVDWRPPQ